jgi:hypothetical protein
MALRVSRSHKAVALTAAVGLTLALSACGGDDNSGGTSAGGTSDCSAYKTFVFIYWSTF